LYFIKKQFLPYVKFYSLYSLLASIKTPTTTFIYHDKKSCANLIACISNVIKKIYKIRNSSLYGIMIDESTDISVTGHLVVFDTIIEKCMPMIVFLGLLEIEGGKNAIIIFECLMNHLKVWELDLCKCAAFRSDGASTMVGSHSGVATILKNYLNLFFLSCHCVAHRTKLTALYASKTSDCKIICDEVDTLLNAIAYLFNMSSNVNMQS
jgi:hypothetical protein